MADDGMTDGAIDETMDAPLRELYGRALAQRSAAHGTAAVPCVPPEDILALVRRELPEDRRLDVLDHVMACADCRREFELFRALEAAGDRLVPAADPEPVARPAPPTVVDISTRRRRPWGRTVPFALAASLLLAMGVQAWRRSANRERSDVMRGDESGVTTIAPAGEVAGTARGVAPLVFAWRPVAGAVRYELEVLDGEGSVVYSASTGDTTVAAPRVASGRLTPGTEYRWWVRAVTPDGAQPRSALRTFRLRAE